MCLRKKIQNRAHLRTERKAWVKMKKSYKLVIFDMDGTILDTLKDLHASVNYALNGCGYPLRSIDEVRQFVGNGIRKLIERSVPQGTVVTDTDKVFELFKEHYAVHCADSTMPYSGIPELIHTLREHDIKTAVVSNKADFAVRELCVRYFDGLFDCAVGEREGVRRKPYADSVNEVLSELGIYKEDAVYVGDSEVDIQTAQNAGTDCISVAWGFRERTLLLDNGAEIIVSDISELKERLI